MSMLRFSLLEMLAGITDPRDARGIRHWLVAVLGIAVVATLAGAANFRESGSVAADLPQHLLALLGWRPPPVHRAECRHATTGADRTGC